MGALARLKGLFPSIRLTIRDRLRVTAVAGFFCILLVEIASLATLQDLSQVPDRLDRHVSRVGLALRDVRVELGIIENELAALTETTTPLRARAFERRTGDARGRITTGVETVSDGLLDGHSDLARLQALLVEWDVVRTQILGAIAARDRIAAYTLAKTEGLGIVAGANMSLAELELRASAISDRLRADVSGKAASAFAWLMAVLVIAVVAMFVMVRYVTHTIITPTTDISAAIRRVAEGTTEIVIPHAQRLDEIGDIARSAEVFLHRAIAIRNAQLDVLTGLPSREQLHERLRQLRVTAEAQSRGAALLHLDVDRLGELNDSLGRSVGDAALLRVAQRLREWLEDDDMLARESGDSFVMLLLDRGSLADAESLAQEISQSVRAPMQIGERQVTMTCSIGLTACTDDTSVEDLLLQAENAVLEGRKSALGRVQVYTTEMDARLRYRRKTLLALKEALDRDEIAPFFQPQVNAVDGCLVGFEALVRWHHPQLGLLSPRQFMDIAAEAGLLAFVTDEMVTKAARQLAAWRRQGLDVPRVSLNLAASDLAKPDFVDRFQLMVEREGLAPPDICVELLETAMIDDTESPVTRTLERLEGLGFPIELDDFGTGHAAISTLHIIKLSGLKIDRSFVSRLHERPEQQHLTRGILRISNALKIATVAEGVETLAERQTLIEFGCEVLQGYLISPPLSGPDATQWLATYDPAGFMAELDAASAHAVNGLAAS